MAERSIPDAADQSDRHRVEAEPEVTGREKQHEVATNVDADSVPAYGPIPDPPARPRNPRWLWLIPIGAIGAGAILGILPFLEDFGRPPDVAVPLPAPLTSRELTAQPSTPPQPSATPTPSPPSPRTPAAPAVTQTTQTTESVQTPTPSPGPVLLGPSTDNELETMVQRYCDRHPGGLADPRDDGRWECRRLLSASIVNLDIACRDTYGSAAYAQTSNAGDPYAWRCYR